VYGVVLDDAGLPQAEATTARRAELDAAPPPPPARLAIDPQHAELAHSLDKYVKAP